MFRIYIFFLCLISIGRNAAQSPFVTVKQHQFFISNKPYYYIGSNYWYGPYLASQKDKAKGVERLRSELDFLKAKGITNLRLLAGAEGTGMENGVERVKPSLQPAQGRFDASMLEGLDLILFEMGKRNMKAVIFLSNNWEWSGGFMQYANWNGLMSDSVLRRKLNWNEQRDFTSQFYTCSNCMAGYNKQVEFVINHTNKYSKKKYNQDPAIMAWELANEPRPMRQSANEAYKHWISNAAAFIKSIDKNHLVTIGHEGSMGTDGDMQLYEQVHADKNVDYLTIHVWPKNWGWFREATFQKDVPAVINNSLQYLDKHLAVATRLHKPLVVEEFGLPRDNQSFSITATTALRDNYYSKFFSAWKKSKETGGALAGVNFWAYGGTARPKEGQIFWKDGDEYMGDPPMEEQGLNSVFNSDTSTWQLIESFTK